jgi:hypothetical protein
MQLNKSHRKPYIERKLSKEQWAYLSGIIDGEAHIRRYVIRKRPNGDHYGVEIAIGQIDRKLLDTLQEWLGAGSVRLKKSPSITPFYIFCLKNVNSVWYVLRNVEKHLIVKKERANDLLSYFKREYGQHVKQV